MGDQTGNGRYKSAQFLRQVSNGLRTSLNVIKGTADIAQTEIYDIETVKEGFRKIGESSDFLLNVVNDIVDFVTIENGELTLQNEPFNLKNLINRFTAKYYTQAARDNKYLDTQIHGVIHEELEGDEHYVEYILDCMLMNALKYTNNKDKLYFRIFEYGIAENKVDIRFTLTGSGSTIYEKLSKTVNEKIITGATDLALYNSHYILTEMGGSIEIRKEDNNSVIIIDMPIDIKTDNDEDDSRKLFDNENILIICDEKQDASERGGLLKEMGVSYEAASDPEEALELIGAAEESGHPFNACIIDWNIKGFVIQDLVNEIHTIFGKNMSLIAMAYNDEKVRDKAQKMGFDYVMKRAWFRSTVCDVLMKDVQGQWEDQKIDSRKVQYDFGGRRILVAEDSRLNMEFIKKILKNVRTDVIEASDGIEAYNIYKDEPEFYFDCILMDVNMPEMDGCETAKKIRSSGREDAKSVPIFALTANAFQSDIKKSIDAGMDGHFCKPVDIEELYATLDNVFHEMELGIYQNRHVIEEPEIILRESSQKKIDPQTGLLSLHGFEERIETMRYLRDPVGFLFIEVNGYEEIKSSRGEAVLSKFIKRIADCLKNEFRRSDLLAYYGGGRFAAALNYCDNGIEFVERKIREINLEITENEKELPNAGISVGAAYSANGFSSRLVSLADEALEHVKQVGNYGCYILNDDIDNAAKACEGSIEKVMYGGEIFSFGKESIAGIDNFDEMLTLLLGENQAVGIMCGLFDEEFSISCASRIALSNLGYTAEKFVEQTGAKLVNILAPGDAELLKSKAIGHEMETWRLRFRHEDGHILWFNSIYTSLINANGTRMWMASFRPYDDSVVGGLVESDYKAVSLIHKKEKMVIIEKGADKLASGNLKLRKMYDYKTFVKEVLSRLYSEDDRDEYLYNTDLDTIISQLENKGLYEFVAYHKDKGASGPVRYKYRYIDEVKDIILWTCEEIENLADSDNITSLLNETGFYRQARMKLDLEENKDKEYAVIYWNIKDFKSCNDILGFSNGNFLLRKYAELLKNSKLEPVCCGRFHADKFYALVDKEKVDPAEISSLCFRRENISGHHLNIRIHCGIYFVDDRKQEISAMCDKAVLAADSITNEYAMPYYVFDSNVNKTYQNRVFVLNNLERAYARDEFCVYYQPVCDTRTGRVCSAEALIRWIMPGGKVVSPGVFVPVLESKGYISRLDFLVSEKVQEYIEARSFDQKKMVPVSVNLSRMDFANDVFLKKLKEQIDNVKVDKSLFRYEVTESAYINVGDDGRSLLEDIRKNNSKIYIDDFGTGYSSLQNLMEVHFDILKLDMYFIRRIGTNIVSEGIIKGAISICHQLGRKVIAEGVETKEQYEFLLENDCDYIQGYYFHKPMSEQEFSKLLDAEEALEENAKS